jgi:hypothetical protein
MPTELMKERLYTMEKLQHANSEGRPNADNG